MSYFPMDVTADILSRLPVKPLLRFRCVSKLWCALIDSRDFVKLHLNRSIKTKNNISLLINDGNIIYSVDFDSLDYAVELDHPFKCSNFGTEVLGSCNGLVCLSDGDEDVAIWNPSTRQYRKLPITEVENRNPFYVSQYKIYAMGYDSVGDDYKLVRIVEFYGEGVWDSSDSEVKVFSLKSNSWRRIQDFPYYLCYKRCNGVLASGALHWVVTRKSSESDTANLIAAFDIATEEYRLVPQPNFSGDKKFDVNVGAVEDCLWMLCNYRRVCVDVWVMKDYGVKESWIKLFLVTQPEPIRSFEFLTPLAYSKSGSEVLLVQDNEKLLWYNLEQKTVKNINIRRFPNYFETVICVESLVPLKGGGETDGKKQYEQEKKEKEKEKEEAPAKAKAE